MNSNSPAQPTAALSGARPRVDTHSSRYSSETPKQLLFIANAAPM